MEYKLGDYIKLMPFLDMCRMGKIQYGVGNLRTVVRFPDGMSYTLDTLRKAGGVTAKVVEINESGAGPVYDVTWIDGVMKVTFRLRPYLIECKILSMVKCEVDDMDVARSKFKSKALAAKNREEINKRVLKRAKLEPKGKK